jgi:hypothetical protein
MGLRNDWQAAKSVAKDVFKKEHPVSVQGGMPVADPYTLLFKEDLGPTLDAFEKAKKPEDRAKYIKKGKEVIASYKAQIGKTKDLKTAGKLLTDSLNKIEAKLK